MKTLYENRAFFNFVTLSPFRSEGAKQINHPLYAGAHRRLYRHNKNTPNELQYGCSSQL